MLRSLESPILKLDGLKELSRQELEYYVGGSHFKDLHIEPSLVLAIGVSPCGGKRTGVLLPS